MLKINYVNTIKRCIHNIIMAWVRIIFFYLDRNRNIAISEWKLVCHDGRRLHLLNYVAFSRLTFRDSWTNAIHLIFYPFSTLLWVMLIVLNNIISIFSFYYSKNTLFSVTFLCEIFTFNPYLNSLEDLQVNNIYVKDDI